MHTFRTGTRMRKWLERLAVLVAAGTLTLPAFGQGFGGRGGGSQPVSGSGFAPPAPAPQRPGTPGAPDAITGAPGTSQEVRADVILNVGDTFQLRHDSGKPLKDVIISRPNVVDLEPLKTGPQNTTLSGTARSPGITTVTITAYDAPEPTRKTIQVTPDVKYIESLLVRTFPTANIRLIPGSAANSLIATGTVESAEDVDPVLTFLSAFTNNDRKRVTNALRVSGVMQVQLEVCVARVRRDELRSFGLNFLFADRQNFIGSGIGNVANLSATASATLRDAGAAPLVPVPTLSSVAGAAQPSLQFGITDNASGFLGFLQALRTEGLSKTLANPVLVTTSGRVAEFLVGGEAAAAVAGGATSGSTLQYRAFGTRLAVLPFVLGDGRLRLIVLTEVSQPASTNVTPNIVAPNFIVNRVHTAVEMENRQTLILGGIIQNEVDATAAKVPVLGDLPFIGAAFRSVTYQDRETEVVIMVTAHLVDPLDRGQMAGYMPPGTETRKPTDFELFLEGILEAPRGPRDPFPGKRYVAAHALAPQFGVPQGQCWDGNGCGGSACGTCATDGSVTVPVQHALMPATQIPAAQMPTTQLTTMPMPAAPEMPAGASGMSPPVMPVGSRSIVLPNEVAPAPSSPTEQPIVPVDVPAPPTPPSGPKE